MAKIRIDVFEGGSPSATITIPTWLIARATHLLPKFAGKRLQDQIQFDDLIELMKKPQPSGTLLEVEDHTSKEKLVISIVDQEQSP